MIFIKLSYNSSSDLLLISELASNGLDFSSYDKQSNGDNLVFVETEINILVERSKVLSSIVASCSKMNH